MCSVSGGRARLACFLALRHLLGSQMSSGLQRSPSERRKCSLASGHPDVCLLGQGSSSRYHRGCLKPPFFIHADCQPWLLWASLPRSHTRGRALAGRLPFLRDRDPRGLAAPSLAKLGVTGLPWPPPLSPLLQLGRPMVSQSLDQGLTN